MNVTRPEALDIFRKWLTERTPLRCRILTRQLSSGFTVRVVSVSGDEIGLANDDRTTELTVPLNERLSFGYGDARHLGENAPYDSALVVFLEPVPATGYPDLISFSEFANPPSAA